MSGLDCYGFVRLVLKDVGYNLPLYSFDHDGNQEETFLQMVKGFRKTEPGNYDIIYLNSPGVSEHIGVFIDGLVWQMDSRGISSTPWKRIKGRVKEVYELEM